MTEEDETNTSFITDRNTYYYLLTLCSTESSEQRMVVMEAYTNDKLIKLSNLVIHITKSRKYLSCLRGIT